MNWLGFALIGYFLNSVVSLTDKFFLTQRATTNPVVYTFYVGILSIFALILAPFGLKWFGLNQFLTALLAGALFLTALFYLFRALDVNEASRVFPIVGGLTPILILVLSFIFLNERLILKQIFAFFLLVSGGALITLKPSVKGVLIKGIRFIGLAILFGAASLVLTKYVFINQGFISGFIWTRIGIFLTALLFLIPERWREAIIMGGKESKGGLSLFLVSNKALAGFASLFINFAVSQGSVSLVNALSGMQYAFLFVLAILLSKKFPFILKEKISGVIIGQKISAILLIGAGLFILMI